jgi:nicotinate-nucleotide adenylyltransferase
MRLGVFGGSFDPVHYGHLLLAEYCRTDCPLDEVRFVPAAVAPHKQHLQAVSADHRTQMLQLAIGGHESFSVSELEIERGGVSYTVETLESLHREDPQRQLFLLLGADSLFDVPNWKNPARICELATLVVVRRVDSPEPDFSCLADFATPAQIDAFRQHQVSMPLIELSSTTIRQRIAAGRSIRFQTPRAVEKYIEAHQLYGSTDEGVGSLFS